MRTISRFDWACNKNLALKTFVHGYGSVNKYMSMCLYAHLEIDGKNWKKSTCGDSNINYVVVLSL